MNIRKIYKSLLIFILALFIPATGICAGKNTPKITSPKSNSQANNKQSSLSMQAQKGMKYVSPLDQNALERQFKELMSAKGFTYRRDKDIRSKAMRRLCFEKDNLTVDVVLAALKGKGTEVIMSKYLSSEVILDAKQAVTYLKNPSVELPNYKQDNKSKLVSYKPVEDRELETSDIGMEIPVPPQSEEVKEKVPDPLLGVGGFGKVFQSEVNNPQEVENFYRRALKKLGFHEKQGRGFKVMNFKGLRFESNNMAIELYLSARGDKGSHFIVVKYMDKDGVAKIEANPLYMVKLPEKDNPGGSDLADVPRPASSVRRGGGAGKGGSASYITSMGVIDVSNFYKQEMPAFGWKLSDEVNIRANDAEYAKKHKGEGFVKSVPIGTKVDLGDVIRDSIVLEFKSRMDTVQIMIYPNFVNPALGSMVDITYIYPKTQGKN